jgi:putative hydrolases of HD superfamily
MENEAIRILNFLRFSEKLKTQLRDCLVSTGREESVADHSWHLALMAFLTSPHLKNKIDLLKTLKMILIHDLTEAQIGDIPFSHATENPNLKIEKQKAELVEIKKIKDLIGGELGEEVFSLWEEYEERKSPEAKFVKALDCMEANYQSILYGDISYWDDIYYDVILSKSDNHCTHEPILIKLNEEIKRRTEPELTKIGLDVEKLKNANKT